MQRIRRHAEGSSSKAPEGRPLPVMAQSAVEFRADGDASLKILFDLPDTEGEEAPAFTFQQGGESFRSVRVD